jgi:hypothetical protein
MALSDATRLADFATGVGTDGTLSANNINATGIVTATSFVGSGADLTDVISGIGITAGSVTANLGTGLTAVNFSGADVSFHEASGISTITIAKELVIGVRTGTAVTFSISGGSFNVLAKAGGNVPINV